MMTIIGYLLLAIFLWSFSGILLGFLTLLSKNQREYTKVKCETDPEFLQKVFYALALFGPIGYIIALIYYMGRFVRERIGG